MRKRKINDALNRIDQLETDVAEMQCEQDGGHNFYYWKKCYREFRGVYDYVFRCCECRKECRKLEKQLTEAEKKALKTLEIL